MVVGRQRENLERSGHRVPNPLLTTAELEIQIVDGLCLLTWSPIGCVLFVLLRRIAIGPDGFREMER